MVRFPILLWTIARLLSNTIQSVSSTSALSGSSSRLIFPFILELQVKFTSSLLLIPQTSSFIRNCYLLVLHPFLRIRLQFLCYPFLSFTSGIQTVHKLYWSCLSNYFLPPHANFASNSLTTILFLQSSSSSSCFLFSPLQVSLCILPPN